MFVIFSFVLGVLLVLSVLYFSCWCCWISIFRGWSFVLFVFVLWFMWGWKWIVIISWTYCYRVCCFGFYFIMHFHLLYIYECMNMIERGSWSGWGLSLPTSMTWVQLPCASLLAIFHVFFLFFPILQFIFYYIFMYVISYHQKDHGGVFEALCLPTLMSWVQYLVATFFLFFFFYIF